MKCIVSIYNTRPTVFPTKNYIQPTIYINSAALSVIIDSQVAFCVTHIINSKPAIVYV